MRVSIYTAVVISTLFFHLSLLFSSGGEENSGVEISIGHRRCLACLFTNSTLIEFRVLIHLPGEEENDLLVETERVRGHFGLMNR